MKTSIDNPSPSPMFDGRVMAGVIILVIGLMLLVDQFSMFVIPEWLYSWPMWAIVYGVYMSGKYKFKKPFYLVVIAIGVALLITDNVDNADKVVWPAAIMAAGTWLVLKHSKHPEAADAQHHYTQV